MLPIPGMGLIPDQGTKVPVCHMTNHPPPPKKKGILTSLKARTCCILSNIFWHHIFIFVCVYMDVISFPLKIYLSSRERTSFLVTCPACHPQPSLLGVTSLPLVLDILGIKTVSFSGTSKLSSLVTYVTTTLIKV